MEMKTKLIAEEGRQELHIVRKFELPLELLFKAYTEAEIIEQWMGTKVLKLENRNHGSWRFETTDPTGKVYGFNGTIHEIISNQKITRTFEMENTGSGVQLEFLDFVEIDENTSELNMHIVYRSAAERDKMLQRGMAPGINMAHNRLQESASRFK